MLINGIEEIGIGVTICAPEQPEALPMITVDEPTLTHELPRELVAARGPRRQVRHEPPDPSTA